MNNIININNWRNTMNTKEITVYLKKQKEKQKENKDNYSLLEVSMIANNILSSLDYYFYDSATPIVKIAKDFGFKTYKQKLSKNLSGDICINGNTYDRYGYNQVILVNEFEPFFHQRFVVAHELAHYLFEFIGDSKYKDKNIRFSDTYFRDHHETPQELRANAFAAEILMPKNLFIKQYNISKEMGFDSLYTKKYLSEFFETTINSIQRRIQEVLNHK